MARRIIEPETARPTADRSCDHPLIAIRPGAPAAWRLCDPRLISYTLSPDLRARCGQARAEHTEGEC